jgi:hypothetical protein
MGLAYVMNMKPEAFRDSSCLFLGAKGIASVLDTSAILHGMGYNTDWTATKNNTHYSEEDVKRHLGNIEDGVGTFLLAAVQSENVYLPPMVCHELELFSKSVGTDKDGKGIAPDTLGYYLQKALSHYDLLPGHYRACGKMIGTFVDHIRSKGRVTQDPRYFAIDPQLSDADTSIIWDAVRKSQKRKVAVFTQDLGIVAAMKNMPQIFAHAPDDLAMAIQRASDSVSFVTSYLNYVPTQADHLLAEIERKNGISPNDKERMKSIGSGPLTIGDMLSFEQLQSMSRWLENNNTSRQPDLHLVPANGILTQ